ncbi:MAG: hypothetical protein MUQ27_05305 [Acidimicrobiia bacterium]|nr:hypothetical protein [Acidimicrobiia bacterium]
MRHRTWIILLTLATVMVVALPATADRPDKPGKPDEPSPDPGFYDVTMDLTGAEGLGLCDEPLVMVDMDGSLLADGTEGTSVPRLYLKAGVDPSRTHPETVTGEEFDACHGGALEGSDSDVPSYFIIHTDRSGYISNVLWAFDVYVEEGTKGKNKIPGVKEYFRMWAFEEASFENEFGNGCPLTPTEPVTCFVSGPFDFWHYYPIEQIGVAAFMFTMTITPH